MKKCFLIIMVCLGFCYLNSCTKSENKICACGVKSPQKNLPWLAEFIKTAKKDTSGSYFGVMWLENYNGEDVFVTDMLLSGMPLSGSLPYKVFNCEGKREYEFCENIEDFVYGDYIYLINHLKREIVVYASPDYPLN